MASFPTLAPKSPHFFKVIVADPLAFEKLRIPKKFVRKYGKALSKSVCLEVPTGIAWKVDITRNGKEVWLENGWKQFVESFSLSPGHLLAFRYEGNSKFCVFIFDLRASEIDYKLDGDHDRHLIIAKTEESNEDNVFLENHDDFAPSTQPQKRMRNGSTTSENDDGANVLYPLASHSSDEATHSNRMNLGKSKRKLDFFVEDFAGGDMSTCLLLPQPEDTVIMKSFTFVDKSRALERASAFDTRNPCFKVFMQRSYIYPGTKLSIPANFVHRHFTWKNGDVKLSTSDGRTWSAKYGIKVYNQMEKAWLYSGWRAFMKDNSLKVGDVCVFEMIKCGGVLFKVAIFRETLDADSPPSQDHWSIADHVKFKQKRLTDLEKIENCTSFDILDTNSPIRIQKSEGGRMYARHQRTQSKVYKSLKRLALNENSTNLQKAKAFKSENPSFIVVMQPSYIHTFKLSVPKKFIERHFTEEKGDIILETSNGRTWLAKYKIDERSIRKYAKLYCGWRAFVKDNHLKVSDVCVFELIKGVKISLRVVIFRDSNSAGYPLSQENRNAADRAKLKRKMEPDKEANVQSLNGFSPIRSKKFEGGGKFALRQRIQSKVYRSIYTLSFSEKAPNLLEARAFKSENPSFMVLMHPSYIHAFKLNMPATFIERHFNEKDGEVVLSTSDGRTWSCKYRFHVSTTNMKKSASLHGCWRAFVKDNHLKVGDVCVFELIKGTKISLRVVIFRESNNGNCLPSQDHGSLADRAELKKKMDLKTEANHENATSAYIMNDFSSRSSQEVEGDCGQLACEDRPSSSIISRALETVGEKYPSFRAVMTSAYLHRGRLFVPPSFARKFFVKNSSRIVKLQVADRFWQAKLITYGNMNTYISKGWVAFSRENDLRMGDVCVFELINPKDGIFEVSNLRASS